MSDRVPTETKPSIEGVIHRIGDNEIQVAHHGEVEVLAVRGRQEAQLLQAIENVANRCTRDIGLDLRELRDMMPTLLPLLRRLNRRFEDKRRVLLLYEPPSRLLDLLELGGCAGDFNIYHAAEGLSKKQGIAPQPTRPGAALGAAEPIGKSVDVDSASDSIVRFTHDLQRTQQLESSLEVAGLRTGRMLQRWQPDVPDYQFAVAYLPHDRVGGDFFQLLPLDSAHVGIVVGDVSGHGIEAALLMGMARKVLEIRAQDGSFEDPRATLVQANQDLFPDLDRFTFVTAFYGVLERSSGTLRYGRAGHNYPILVTRNEGQAQALSGGGIAFGIDGGPLFENALETQVAALHPGDSLVLYTDGLIEAAHPHKGQYGLDRLLQFTGQVAPHTDAEELKEAILAEVREFLEGAPLGDDLSLICIQRNPTE